MKILNRPMFRMGGPIKEGIMNGIQEPRRIGYATKGTVSVADQAKAFENIFTTPQVTREQVAQFANRGTPNLNMGTPKINSFEKMQTNNQFGNQNPTIVPKITIDDKIESYTPNSENPFRDLIDYTKKINVYVDENGVKRNRTTGEKITDTDTVSDIETGKASGTDMPPMLDKTGKMGAIDIDEVIKNRGKIDDTPLTKKERTNNILEMLGYDKAKKNALYDAMINAGQRISRTGLGADNLVSDIIQDTSTVYDKPEKLREAANLMDVQQQLKLDQIDASKDKRAPIQKTIEYYMSEDGGNLSRKDATASAKNQPIEAFAIFQEAKSKGTTTEAVDYTASKMASDDKFGEGLRFINRIPTKLKGAEGLQKFIESDAYNGDGVYTRGGEILVIKNGKATNMITFKGTGETGIFGGEK